MHAPESGIVRIVEKQLGRELLIDFKVQTVCGFGWPAVIKNSPFTGSGKPNPNLYYLSCPYLRKKIARLEDAGLKSQLESKLDGDDSLAAGVEAAQRNHDLEWNQAAASSDCDAPGAFRGIAGSRQTRMLKCLHAHFAYYLAHPDYRLGNMIARRIGDIWCPDDYCAGLDAETG